MDKKQYRDILKQQILDIKRENANLYSELIRSDNSILKEIVKVYEDVPMYLYPYYYTALYLTTIKDAFNETMFEKYNLEKPIRNTDRHYLQTSIEKDYYFIMDYYGKLNYCYKEELNLIKNKKLTK